METKSLNSSETIKIEAMKTRKSSKEDEDFPEEEYELRPEFIEEMKRIDKEPTVKIKDFRKHFGL